jgi:predicted neutral ceramidase superfamily lipid hydrolase
MMGKNLNKYLSLQAKVAIVGYLILIVAILVPLPEPHLKNNDMKKPYNLGERLVSILGLLIPMVISIYTINCMVKGSSKGGMPCTVLAWLNSVSVLVWASLVLVLTLVLLNNNSNGVNGVNVEKYNETPNNIYDNVNNQIKAMQDKVDNHKTKNL